ncbi:MAG: hypothetical protein LH609_09670 [Rudanella sp.]|nr:hypothetical protein [Rudanella sp.]
MNKYTLDFAAPVQPPRRTRYQMSREFRQMYGLLCGLVCGIALVGLLRQHSQMQLLREQYQTQTIRYDSLLTDKVETDRKLEQLRAQFLKYQHP